MTKIILMSCGFKYGSPPANHVFDVTSLPNPHRAKGLPRRGYTRWMADQGPIQRRVMAIYRYIMYVGEDEPGVFAICCTGGHHRSVFIVDQLAKILRRDTNWKIRVVHRDRWTE